MKKEKELPKKESKASLKAKGNDSKVNGKEGDDSKPNLQKKSKRTTVNTKKDETAKAKVSRGEHLRSQ